MPRFALVLALAHVACGRVAFENGSDATIGLPPWGQPVPLEISISGDDPSLTADLLELYFNGSSTDLYATTRDAIDQPWSVPVLVLSLDDTANQSTPELSADGLTIYFASGRSGGSGGLDTWMATRSSRGVAWDAPVPIAELSSPVGDHVGGLSADGLTIVIDSKRGGTGDDDLFIATRVSLSDAWSTPRALAALNVAGANDESPALSADGLVLYFGSNRGGDGSLYVASRATTADDFTVAEPIVELNTSGNENDPWTSPDGRHLVFSSARNGISLWHAVR